MGTSKNPNFLSTLVDRSIQGKIKQELLVASISFNEVVAYLLECP